MGKGDGGREAATGLSPRMWAREAAGTIVEPGVTRFFTGSFAGCKKCLHKILFFYNSILQQISFAISPVFG